MKNTKFHGLGRRKSSSARVTIQSGTGKFLINKIEAKQYLKADILIKINSDPKLKEFINNNSYWYKILTRDPKQIGEFINSAKEFYQLRKTDKFKKTLEYIELFQTIIETIK